MMAVTDLLPIPSGTRKPTAYDVFGLKPGEQDPVVIDRAVSTTIERLKSARDRASPDEWKQAARMVDQARQILASPEHKATLDAKLAAANVDASTDDQTWTDPLAGLLPSGNPLEPIWIAPSVTDSTSVRMPPGSFGTPIPSNVPDQQTIAIAGSLDTDGTVLPIQSVASDRSRPAMRRKSTGEVRRKSTGMGTRILGVTSLSLLAITGALAYLFSTGSGQIEITKRGDKIVIKTNANQSDPSKSEPTYPRVTPGTDSSIRPETARRDVVMGDLATNRQVGNQTRSDTNTGVAAGWTDDSLVSDSITRNAETQRPSPPRKPGIDREPIEEPPFDEETSTQKMAIQQLQQQIREAQWSQMKSSAESLLKQPLSANNQSIAEGLYEVADLATYYRNGISRAVADLKAGNEITVIDSFRVIVVETGDDKLIVMYDKQRRSFTFDEFPFSLAHRLANFQVPSGPTGEAAKAVYQAIAPRSTAAYRKQALHWLADIDGEVEGADTERLIKTIRLIYSTSELE